MKQLIVFLYLTSFLLFSCNMEKKRYEANWESLSAYEVPEWFQDAKFGIFIHWGPYSVPAFGSEWYPRFMYQDSVLWDPLDSTKTKPGTAEAFKHHLATYGHPSVFGYKDFIPMFKAEKFDAAEWVGLFKEAGAKYVIPVAEHHDAFAMYNSHVTRWNSVNMGPQKDIVGLISEEAAKAGLKFGVSSHYAFNWDYYNKEERFDTWNPEYEDLYGPKHDRYAPVSKEFTEKWWQRTTDIIDSYHPDILWFDFYWDRAEFADYHAKLAAYYYNMGLENNKEVVLQSKNMFFESFPEGIDVLDIERGKLAGISKYPWQTDTSVGKNSWCYVDNWESKTANSLIDDLIDIVSKNGNLLLNIGPKADGTIPQDQQEVLLAIGGWLKTNGEAIYGTRPWKIYGEGPTQDSEGHHTESKNGTLTSEDIRFTTKGDILFASVLEYNENGSYLIKSLAQNNTFERRPVKSVVFMGGDNQIDWTQTAEGLNINLNGDITDKAALVFKVEFEI